MTPNKPAMSRDMVKGMKSFWPVISPAQTCMKKVTTKLQKMTALRPKTAAHGAIRKGPATHPASAAATELRRSFCVL